MDLKKAFDIVDHQILLEVMEKYGIRGKSLDVFRSYLDEREQVINVDDILSLKAKITTGVVQG
jgi:hypothetical protein